MKVWSLITILVLCALLLIAACAPASNAVPTAPNPANDSKQIATLYISPTPNDADRAATRSASRPTAPPVLIATVPPTPTVYIGVFMGDAAAGSSGVPIVDPSRYEGTRVQVPTMSAMLPCPIAVDVNFGVVWASDTSVMRSIGCPGEPATPYDGASQLFERGTMYSLPTNEFWAIAPASPRGQFWYFEVPPPDLPFPQNVVVPDGLRAPQGGFGTVWKAFADLREGIGFATFDQIETDMLYQRFDNGALLLDESSALVWVLVRGGDAYGPYDP